MTAPVSARPIAVDLFAGGGGLSVGLKKAGFAVVAAVEIDGHAASTYQANHRGTKVFRQDIKQISGQDLLETSPLGRIDLLAGCPPCQGFTSLTAKYAREDPRNQLLFEMLRLVRETRPKAIMMENVPGLAIRGKNLLTPFLQELEELGYHATVDVLQVADYGVPQFRRRLVILAGLGFPIAIPPRTHSNDDPTLPNWKTVRETIQGLPKPRTFSEVRSVSDSSFNNWHVVRDISERNRERLQAATPGGSWKTIPEELRPLCHQGDYTGFSNVYGKMEWDAVSPTITGGCTTPSRGRHGHPSETRTISVREAALLQTFPSDYIFDTPHMDRVCQIIGNALPCDFATAMSEQCLRVLELVDD